MGLLKHKNTVIVSGALSFFITSLPVWQFVSTTQRVGVIGLFAAIIYSLLWLEGDR